MTHSIVRNEVRKDDNTATPLVSVLMPCFNATETVAQSLESILSQSLRNFEVLAVDDGSKDDTLRILQRYAQQDARLRLIALQHSGIITALNTGMQMCRAPLIARMDADDLSLPDRLSKQAAYLNQHPDIAAVSCLVQSFPAADVRQGFRIYTEWLNSLVQPEDIEREIYIESPLPHPSLMLRRSWLERMGGYQEHGWPEDYDLWLRMHLAGARFAKVPEVLVRWREHEQRLTRTSSRYSVKNFLRAKAHYLCQGPVQSRDALIVWGAGQMGRRLSKYLLNEGAPLVAFVDIDPAKIGRTRRGRPIIAPEALMQWWQKYDNPILLTAVGSRGARTLIREQLLSRGLVEGQDWWAAA